MRLRLLAFRRHDRGTAAMEFSIIVPVLLMFIGGVVEMGRMMIAYDAVNRLATRYAGVYADCQDSPAGNNLLSPCGYNGLNVAQDIWVMSQSATLQNMAPQLTSTVTLRMFQVQMSSASPATPTVTYAYPSGSTLTSAETQQAQAIVQPSQTGVVVTVSYPFSLMFFPKVVGKVFFPNNAQAPLGGTATTITYTVAQQKT